MVRHIPDLRKEIRPLHCQPDADHLREFRLQCIDRRIGMAPGKRQRTRVELAGHRPHVVELQHARSLRDQEADRQLDRCDLLYQIEAFDFAQQIKVALGRCPRRERHESRSQDNARVAAQADDALEVGARVLLLQFCQHAIVD